MGFWRKIQETLWTGKTIKDYGVINEKQMGISKCRQSVLLTEREGKKKIIIKESWTAFLGASVAYSEFDRMSTQRLKDALDDALRLM